MKEFTVHKSFAVKSSRLLRAALNPDHGWKEAHDKRVPLPEVEPVDFEWYLEWVYTGHLTPREEDGKHNRGATLIRLYILGDYLDDAKFCNSIMDIVSKPRTLGIIWLPWRIPVGSTNLVWEKNCGWVSTADLHS